MCLIVAGVAAALFISRGHHHPKAKKSKKRVKIAHAATPLPENPAPLFPPDTPIPDFRPLSPEQTLATFQTEPGLKVELVASEPLISAPVAIQWDASGRLWVVEMDGFMPTEDGSGETEASGRIVILEDTDGDGRMDRRTVFLDSLVLPRAISLRGNGALVAEPPRLWWCPDENGDLRADEKISLAENYAVGTNPEHLPNGLLLAMDNWIYSAKSNRRYRFTPAGELLAEATLYRGQWGISQDDIGRLYYNYNQDQLRADLLPASYLARNTHARALGANIVNTPIALDQRVYPGGPTPGVNREGELANGRLAHFTSACGPLIYRGDALGAEYRGNSFICEPAGNLVKRNIHKETGRQITAEDAHPGMEFLFSSSERFRPVNLANGPDGALYVVDMSRGIVAHSTYLTPWLRVQIALRDLSSATRHGRIWRVTRASHKESAPEPLLATATPPELVAALESENGWRRDTAQRLLVEQHNPASLPRLKNAVLHSPAALARLHALWTLEGIEELSSELLLQALTDPAPPVTSAAIRLSEPFLATQPALIEKVTQLALKGRLPVRIQAILTLGELQTPEALATILTSLADLAKEPLARAAAVSGLRGRELAALRYIAESPEWKERAAGRPLVIAILAACVREGGNLGQVAELLSAMAEPSRMRDGWQVWKCRAALAGMAGTSHRKGALPPPQVIPGAETFPMHFDAEPTALGALTASTDEEIRALALEIASKSLWPGKPGAPAALPPALLSEAEQRILARGMADYQVTCAGCHQPSGEGQPGLAPPLARSAWVTGSIQRLGRIALHGLSGPITVRDEQYNLEMPPIGASLTDEQVAGILSYIRQSWGNSAPLVAAHELAEIRRLGAFRGVGWTSEELLQYQ